MFNIGFNEHSIVSKQLVFKLFMCVCECVDCSCPKTGSSRGSAHRVYAAMRDARDAMLDICVHLEAAGLSHSCPGLSDTDFLPVLCVSRPSILLMSRCD